MRTQYQRRSWTSVVIWTAAFVVIVLAAAWQFQWWPTTATDLDGLSPMFRTSSSDEPQAKSPVKHAGHETDADKPDSEDDLFAAQTEPEFPEPPPEAPPVDSGPRPEFKDVPEPPELLPANPDARPIPVPRPSRLAQTVEGELPPLEPGPEPKSPSPADLEPKFTPDPTIRLLGEENPKTQKPQEPEPEANNPSADEWPEGMQAVAGKIEQIDEWMQSSDPKQELLAHKELSTLYWEHPEWREALRKRIETTAEAIYFAKQPHYMTPYTVKPGDQLSKIAKRYNVPWEYLAELNKVDPKKIRPGQKLKVIKGPFAAVIDLHRFELTIQHHGFFVKRYKVGIGKDGTTPIGEFTVKNKLVNPTYYGPDGNVVAADDPENPLGEYWIDIGDSYGIHGTIEPDSIGKAKSRGCIRMLDKEAAEVYGFLGLGAKVIIRR